MTVRIGTQGPPLRAFDMETEVLRQLANIATGAYSGVVDSGDFGITQNGTPNMSVNVAAGQAVIAGTNTPGVQGSYPVYNDGTVNLAVTAADGSHPRIDLVELQVRDTFYGQAADDARLIVKAGTPATSPAVPSTDANSLVLAHIYVGTSVSSILTANINGTTGTNNPDTTAYSVPILGAQTARSNIVLGADITGFSATSFAEIHSSLRVTVRVPPSGQVRVEQKLICTADNNDDITLGVRVDGAGAWYTTAALPWSTTPWTSALPMGTASGAIILSGLSTGLHTLYMGWKTTLGANWACLGHSRGAVAVGTWQMATTVP